MNCVEYCFMGEPLPAPRVRMKGRHGFHTKAYKEYREALLAALNIAKKGIETPLTGELELSVRFYRSTKRRVDIDNLLKALMDGLQEAGAVKNDDQIVRINLCEVVKGAETPGIIGYVRKMQR